MNDLSNQASRGMIASILHRQVNNLVVRVKTRPGLQSDVALNFVKNFPLKKFFFHRSEVSHPCDRPPRHASAIRMKDKLFKREILKGKAPHHYVIEKEDEGKKRGVAALCARGGTRCSAGALEI